MLKEKDLDIVLIATPDHWHALPMIAAVEAGADVYVQKPISVDVAEGQAMLAAARKHKRVVQVGTQRRSTPHLIEARDQHRQAKASSARSAWSRSTATTTCAPATIRPTPRRRNTSITRCGPAPRRCGPTTSWSIRAAGAPSWNTATASSATCASTCSTWSAGCSTSAGRKRVSSTGGILVDKESKANISDTQTATFDFGDLNVVWQHRTWGESPDPEVSLGRDVLRRQGHAQGQRRSATTSRRSASGEADPPGRRPTSSSNIPRTRPRRTWRSTSPRPSAATCRTSWTAIATRGKPVADIEQGHISTASCILANLSMKLGRSLTWDAEKQQVVGDDEANKLLRRPYRQPWVHPGVPG